jgi:hypothetical protein
VKHTGRLIWRAIALSTTRREVIHNQHEFSTACAHQRGGDSTSSRTSSVSAVPSPTRWPRRAGLHLAPRSPTHLSGGLSAGCRDRDSAPATFPSNLARGCPDISLSTGPCDPRVPRRLSLPRGRTAGAPAGPRVAAQPRRSPAHGAAGPCEPARPRPCGDSGRRAPGRPPRTTPAPTHRVRTPGVRRRRRTLPERAPGPADAGTGGSCAPRRRSRDDDPRHDRTGQNKSRSSCVGRSLAPHKLFGIGREECRTPVVIGKAFIHIHVHN